MTIDDEIANLRRLATADEGQWYNDFYAYLPDHRFIYAPTGDLWTATSINELYPPINKIPAAKWLVQNRGVEQITWSPADPQLIHGKLMAQGGWIEKDGDCCFNLYRPSNLPLGDASKATPWIEHVHKIYPDDAEHIIRWFAQRLQSPADKINHALVLGSNRQGIGKDTLIEPVKRAIGHWNFQETSPQGIMGEFTPFLKAVILRISEAHDLGEFNRFQCYQRMKSFTASPPDVLVVNEKYVPQYSIPNCIGVIVTTNHKDAIYLPAEDRRHYVAWSNATQSDFTEDYWSRLWGFINSGGDSHVAAYLMDLDISDFNVKAPPPKTPVFWEIVSTNQAPEDSEMADLIDHLGNPNALTLGDIIKTAVDNCDHNFAAWLSDRKNRRAIPHRMDKVGYVSVRNEADKRDGQWKIHGKRQTVYAKSELSFHERCRAASRLAINQQAALLPAKGSLQEQLERLS
jgi:hypothetical protein